ncbi:hypothetical protein BT96DRAFT_977584 [Gymnopus androsaceus JB14]|uniref:DUF6533 domain-containing protein n=1 Tax=Gymnopus androsaceus JB14 TaxID=1447944 RepID=A0A6A4HCY7_9AGAR|nr:hypothetical protein BT96DRAFT_977584 [Gymnopus androsaceus JB14]
MDDVIALLVDSQILMYIKVAMLALLSYDYFLSLAQEVAFVWSSDWSFVKVLYLVSRYSPFIDTILVVEGRLSADITIASCNSTMTFTTIFAAAGIALSDLILVARTYVVYQRSRKVLIVLVVSWIVLSIVNIATATFWTKSPSEVDPSSIISGIPLCLQRNITSHIGMINYVALLVFETIVAALTLWKVFTQQYFKFGFSWTSETTRNLVLTFYRDGLLFYMFILPITLGNALVLAFAPPELQVLEIPLRVMHSILCCRLVIHIREVAYMDREGCKDGLALQVPSPGDASAEYMTAQGNPSCRGSV